jgi:CDP-diacylglycerol--glycerol-3-phosphate 3-phosphatidyltransferase
MLHYNFNWFFGVEWSVLQVNMHNFGMFFFYIAFALTLWSGIDYLQKFFRVVAR